LYSIIDGTLWGPVNNNIKNNIKKENIIVILFKAKPKNQTLTVARYNDNENGKWQR
jgi:hypothetical protein